MDLSKPVALYPEYFNDVFGPVMQPGSASHTAGPCRLGYLAHALLHHPLSAITVTLDEHGSFSGTFGLMREDLGMLSGAYGLLPDDERLFQIQNILDRAQIRHEFAFKHIDYSDHPNAVAFSLTDRDDETHELLGVSTGGGMIETLLVDGFPFVSQGDSYSLLVYADDALDSAQLQARLERLELRGVLESGQSDNINTDSPWTHLYWYKLEDEPQQISALQSITVAGASCRITVLPPVLPVCTTRSKQPQLFDSITQWRREAEHKGVDLYATAIEYEIRASGWGKQQVVDQMNHLRDVMDAQIHTVYRDESKLLEDPFSGFHFRRWRDYQQAGNPASGSALQLALHYVFGVQAFCSGVCIVPGPMCTGGGFLYATLEAVRATQSLSQTDLQRGMFIAAGVGAICYTRSSPTGEIIGCTGECGFNAAMIAAGLTEMRSGSPQQVEDAASLTLQACIGWPCDPIPGGDNQPCLSRFVAAVSSAITFSDLALSGRTALIPFHEVVDQADAIGRSLPSALRCTSAGGLCDTPTARARLSNFHAWRTTNSTRRRPSTNGSNGRQQTTR